MTDIPEAAVVAAEAAWFVSEHLGPNAAMRDALAAAIPLLGEGKLVAWRYRLIDDPPDHWAYTRGSPPVGKIFESEPLYAHPSDLLARVLSVLSKIDLEELDRGVVETGMHEDNSTSLYDVDGASDVMQITAEIIRNLRDEIEKAITK